MLIFTIILVLILLFLFLPISGKKYESSSPTHHFDERDTMFSRNEIEPGEKRFDDYYKSNPQKKKIDDNFRSLPSLLNKNSTYYNKYAYAAAEASFDTVKLFFSSRFGDDKAMAKKDCNSVEAKILSEFIKAWTLKMGAHSVGMTELKDYHLYTIGGRKERYGKPIENNHKYAIVFTVEMDYELTMTGPQSPIVMESARQYLNSGMIATQLAFTLRNLGYEGTTHIDANYDLICTLVAKDAGLGEIGRMGLLMTPKLGPRVRIAVVTTNAPLLPHQATHSNSVIDFCTHCKKCANVCPSAAIPFDDRKEIEGSLRWQINQESCFTYWCKAGTDCGRCMAVCPYSHKSNLLHNFVRWGNSNNVFFRRLAIKLDDVFYGKKPVQTDMPNWVKD